MKRRTVLARLAALTASGGVALSADMFLPSAALARSRQAESGDAFASSFREVPGHFEPRTVRFDKPLPANLQGTLYRNGPARMELGSTRYRHWFDGDGMIHSFRLGGQELVHQGRLVRTTRSIAEDEAGRYLWPGFGTTFRDARSVHKPDDMNVGNISVLPLDDELLALWEGGSAWRIDPQTLETRGHKVFSPETDGLPFSAHPRTDSTGRIWSFGYMSGSGKLVLYEIDRAGRLLQIKLIDAPNADMVHDFAVTERYLVFLLMPLHYRKSDDQVVHSFLDQMAWDPRGAVEVVVVDKATLAVTHRMQTSPFFAFHFGNAWEDGQSLRVEVARSPDFDPLMDAITRATTGQDNRELKREQSMQLVIDLKQSKVRSELLPVVGADFPRFDQRFTGLPTNRLFMMGESDDRETTQFGFNQVVSVERSRGRIQRWNYPAHVLAEEHVFVPAKGRPEGSGWLLGSAYDPQKGRTSLQVFDAGAVDAGPIASASLPYHLPLGLHGQFVPT